MKHFATRPTSPLRLAAAFGLFVGLSGGTADAQTTFFGPEPNDTKEIANEALGMVDGDSIEAGGYCMYVGLNFFRVRTAPALPGIYEHRLSRDLSGIGYFSHIDVYGRDAYTDLVLPQSIDRVATSRDVLSQEPFISWYGFGKAEELYIELGDTGSCRGGSRASLSTQAVVPTPLPAVPAPNNDPVYLSIVTSSPGFQVDTELHVFDAEFNAIPGYWSDDPYVYSPSALLDVRLPPGRYYLALSDSGLVAHHPPTATTPETATPAAVLDFAGAILSGSADSGLSMSIALVGSMGMVGAPVHVTKTDEFEVLWFSLDVGLGQSTFSFCPGDGTLQACPCGTDAPLGSRMGCVNSTGRGATLISSYPNHLTPLRLTAEDLPPGALALVFASLAIQSAQPVHGGLLCLAPGGYRFPSVTANAVGTASLDLPIGGVPSVLIGQTVFTQAAYRDVSAPPCSVNFTSGVSFVLL